MTFINKLHSTPQNYSDFTVPLNIQASDISIVIPVRNNQEGLDLFLTEFFNTQSPHIYPKEIIIVDNNSSPAITISQHFQGNNLSIRLLKCAKNDVASARNVGINYAKGDWILFTDSHCIPSESFIQGYLNTINGSIGYAGNVKAWGNDLLSKFYEGQERFIPLTMIEECQISRPESLITANALIWKKALQQIGGFKETIIIPEGADLDLAFRLFQIGQLSYCWQSTVYPNHNKEIPEFIQRFINDQNSKLMVSNLYDI
ncbi:MAG: glycosyltransferase [Moorea sp. SIOASIH]|uniref:glycosyltransferase family 2 protein n=1 Tax=Moorena sp. SIOASIH TaxID=2607817 RepID=UPI0013BD5BA7|nr:glycosyltransferase [Moorena sp. SIOASIH]NEO35688.1 glycosyltransferase [Moorena sp. SIOASIH]